MTAQGGGAELRQGKPEANDQGPSPLVMRSLSTVEREQRAEREQQNQDHAWQRTAPGDIDPSLINHGSSLSDYEIDFGETGVLGTGTYSTVRVALHKKTGRRLAVKAIDLVSAEPDTIVRLQREIQVLRALKHQNIIELSEVIQENGKLYLMMELCTGGELWHFLQDVKIMPNGDKYFRSKTRGMVLLTEAKIASLIRGIVEAVHFCHERKVCHRDLKLENLMLEHQGEDASVKLIDFGFSKIFNSTDGLFAVLGSPYYVAHEVLFTNNNKSTGYGPACDMWSVGVITYMLLCGQAPFDGKNDFERLEAVRRGTFTFPRHIKLSAHAVGFIAGLLFLDPEKRLTATAALQHPWLADVSPSGSQAREPRKSTLSWLLCR